MPPQNTSVVEPPILEDDFLLSADDLIHDDHSELEDRGIDINLTKIISDIRNLDFTKVVWRNVILFILLHTYSVYGLYLLVTACMWKTLMFTYCLYFMSAMGITMGVHRLWAHRSYKANFPLRCILAFCQTLAFQNSIYEWSRDHRVHHKFSETDADPHNAKRGFFFSHMGWLMYRKHPKVIEKGKTLDMSDLLKDPIVRFQNTFYVPLVLLTCFVMPSVVPWYLWKESFVNALMVPGFLRYTVVLHVTWLVNSLAHWIGSKPYNKYISPSENKVVAYLAMGEGWHNYHHTFPWDYRTAELGGDINRNMTTLVIKFFERIGWVWDLKTVSPEVFQQRALRTGDGSHPVNAKIRVD